MESYESTRESGAVGKNGGVTQYDVQLQEINTKLDFIQLKITENCTNLTSFMAACKQDDGKIHERIDDIEAKLLDFVPRTALDSRLDLVIAAQPSKEDIKEAKDEALSAKFYSKASIAGDFLLALLFVTVFLYHLMGTSR